MSYEPVKVFSGSIASGASTLTSVDIVKSWNKVYIELPTMSTATTFSVFGSSDNTNFRPVFNRAVSTQAVFYTTMTVESQVGANGGIAEFTAPLRYIQLRGDAVVSGGVEVNFICIG